MNANTAAAQTRAEIIRKMDRLEHGKAYKDKPYTMRWLFLRSFINGMAKRASAKKGGLGRK